MSQLYIMEYYSKAQPNLIAPEVKKTVYKIIQSGTAKQTISEKISSTMSDFYKNYIENHRGKVFIVVIIIVFLLYRYYNRTLKEEQIDDQEPFIDQTAHLRFDTQPSFDRLQSVDDQAEQVYYPPDPLPVNLPGQGMVYRRNIYPQEQGYPNLIKPNVDYNNVNNAQGRDYYSGMQNPYRHSQDTNIPNALGYPTGIGYPTNFNSSTGHFVGQMTNANQQNLLDYQTILDSTNGNLIDSLKIGPKYLDENIEMEPPYA